MARTTHDTKSTFDKIETLLSERKTYKKLFEIKKF